MTEQKKDSLEMTENKLEKETPDIAYLASILEFSLLQQQLIDEVCSKINPNLRKNKDVICLLRRALHLNITQISSLKNQIGFYDKEVLKKIVGFSSSEILDNNLYAPEFPRKG